MPRVSRFSFSCVTTQGGLFPAEFLARLAVASGKDAPEGLTPADYHLPGAERLAEAVNRSWNALTGRWEDFSKRIGILRDGDAATGLTRDHWLLPLFDELGFGRLQPAQKLVIEDREYPVSHFWGRVPLHLLGVGLDLDRRTPGATGAARMSPHSMVQEFLNRSESTLWGVVTNGRRLRLLRDNAALTRQAYVEFDLESLFDGNHFSDFALLWLLCHQSRFEGDRPELCWLEKWTQEARKQGVRLLDRLRDGVEEAIEALGTGFLAHRENQALRDQLHGGQLNTQDYYREVLRVVYRLIFLFVAEDRGLLLQPSAPAAARERYRRYYSTQRLRDLALRRPGTAHGDLWEMLSVVMRALGSDAGCPALALPALGSFLWRDAEAIPHLAGLRLANRHLLSATRALATTRSAQEKVRRVVDYRNLGAEELGSVYESLLELHPRINLSTRAFALATAAGHERKTSGSYYTPDPPVQCLLDSALEPVIDEAVKGKRGTAAADAVLALKVCDPAVGSGHFLIAAAHRMAKRVAAARTGEDEPTPGAIHTALRDVIGHCLYGVDINPMSAELCKVNLWLEALDPGRPLSFLDHHIQVGNSLLGATPALIKRGIPDEAYDPLEGDDKEACAALRKRNKRENPKLGEWYVADENAIRDRLFQAAVAIDKMADNRPEDVRRKEAAFQAAQRSNDFQTARDLADLWCAAFVIVKRFPGSGTPSAASDQPPSVSASSPPVPLQRSLFGGPEEPPNQTAQRPKTPRYAGTEPPLGITTQHLRDFVDGQTPPDSLLTEAKQLAIQYRFLHWHLAFPDVFQPLENPDPQDSNGWKGGFDVVLGNPPWDTLSPDAKEFFSVYNPEVRFLDEKGQQALIDGLLTQRNIAARWIDHRRGLFGLVHFLKESGRYVLYAAGNLGKGDFNIYRMFVELALRTVRPGGRCAQFVPEGIYNGANCAAIRQELLTRTKWQRLLGFENNRGIWFPGVHTAMKFALYTAGVPGSTDRLPVRFGIRTMDDLAAAARGDVLDLPVNLIREFSPEALAVMEFTDQRDIDIAAKMYALWPKFGDKAAGPPVRKYMREVDMGNDRDLFTEDPAGVPVYEGRMVDQYDHRAKGYRSGRGRAAEWAELDFGQPGKSIQPQWRILRERIPEKALSRFFSYRIGFCDVTSPTNERALIAALISPEMICGHSIPTFLYLEHHEWAYCLWLAVANSFVMDWLVRQKVQMHVTLSVMDTLPFPRLAPTDPIARSLVPRVLRLTCCGPEMTAFWNALAAEGWCAPVDPAGPPPGVEDPEIRFRLRAEIDALVARDLFGLTAGELAYILDTFPIVRRKDEEQHGSFRTKATILSIYDTMAAAARTGKPSQTK